MHRHGIRPGEDSGRLAVFTCAVSEEKRIVGREKARKLRCLPYEGMDEHRATVDFSAGAENEVFGHHVRPDENGVVGFRHYRTVDKARGSVDGCVRPDVEVVDGPGVDDGDVVGNFAA